MRGADSCCLLRARCVPGTAQGLRRLRPVQDALVSLFLYLTPETKPQRGEVARFPSAPVGLSGAGNEAEPGQFTRKRNLLEGCRVLMESSGRLETRLRNTELKTSQQASKQKECGLASNWIGSQDLRLDPAKPGSPRRQVDTGGRVWGRSEDWRTGRPARGCEGVCVLRTTVGTGGPPISQARPLAGGFAFLHLQIFLQELRGQSRTSGRSGLTKWISQPSPRSAVTSRLPPLCVEGLGMAVGRRRGAQREGGLPGGQDPSSTLVPCPLAPLPPLTPF
uniref:Uncharacterized protein LOC123616233 n=1 Tax=Camelus bactrianus TaxID=9837 RepID=A0A9W3G2D2_CAMBA|nr:uncharacterized protein LOC123616233 [Camelus bactrianus]